jgi:hypothetical protein
MPALRQSGIAGLWGKNTPEDLAGRDAKRDAALFLFKRTG